MDYLDPSDGAVRLVEFREKIKSLPIEELIALATVMKRSANDLKEELDVLAEQIAQRHVQQLRQKHADSQTAAR